MHKLKLFIVFYKSTLAFSILFALAVAIIGGGAGFITVFAVAFMSGGAALSLAYKEATRKNEYFYYQNLGLAKSALIIACILLNIFIGLAFIVYDNA